MPNWVKNKIITRPTFIATELPNLLTEDNGVKDFDFNKVVARPSALSIEKSSNSELGLYAYVYSQDTATQHELLNLISDCDPFSDMVQQRLTHENVEKKFSEKTESEQEELLNLGKQQIDNLKAYGSTDWYDWSLKNWGTKWNACETQIEDNISFSYETAWSPAVMVFKALTEKYPDYKFILLYSDEEMGAHCGYIMAQNGRVDASGEFIDFSVDAYKLAQELWDIDLSEEIAQAQAETNDSDIVQ